jgi:hypothetical protein
VFHTTGATAPGRHLWRGQWRSARRRGSGPATKHAAPRPWRASVALPAELGNRDTIPKPDGLAGRVPALSSNENRMKPDAVRLCATSVRAGSGPRSQCVRGLPFGGPAACFLLEDHAGEDLLDDLLGLGIEAADGLELELERIIWAALILGKK